jgi:hypothetical protein
MDFTIFPWKVERVMPGLDASSRSRTRAIGFPGTLPNGRSINTERGDHKRIRSHSLYASARKAPIAAVTLLDPDKPAPERGYPVSASPSTSYSRTLSGKISTSSSPRSTSKPAIASRFTLAASNTDAYL